MCTEVYTLRGCLRRAQVTVELLRAAFAPFGEIREVSIPVDRESGEPRGFGFVVYEERGDAEHALENMHGAEIYGRALRVNFALAERQSAAAVD